MQLSSLKQLWCAMRGSHTVVLLLTPLYEKTFLTFFNSRRTLFLWDCSFKPKAAKQPLHPDICCKSPVIFVNSFKLFDSLVESSVLLFRRKVSPILVSEILFCCYIVVTCIDSNVVSYHLHLPFV